MKIAVVPGDGIGVDVTAEAVKVLERVARQRGLDVRAGLLSLERGPLPEDRSDDSRRAASTTGARNYDAVFMGAFGDPRVPDMKHAADILLGARFQLDLYVNYRPVRCLDDRLCPLKGYGARDVDFVVFRENTEGSYVGVGRAPQEGNAATRSRCRRTSRPARASSGSSATRSNSPSARGRRRVVMSDKSNAMRFVGDLWQRTFAEVAREYPAIEASHLYIDALCMQMVKDPRQFEVIVTNNMFGDIATDLGAALQGGLGMAASGNLHPGRVSMFEPVHGSAPKYAGTGKANPFGAILTAGLLLDHLGHGAEAAAVEAAVAACVRDGRGDRRRGRDR